MKRLFKTFLRNYTFRRQLGIAVTSGVLCMALFSSLMSSWQGKERVRRNLVEQGQRVTENLARQSALALLYASPDNATEAVNATLAFQGVEYVEIRDTDLHVLLARGSVNPAEMPDTSAPRALPAAGEDVTAVLLAENEYAWKFEAPVMSRPGAASPFQMQEVARELLGTVSVIMGKSALDEIARDIFLVNIASSFSFALLFLVVISFLTNRMNRPLDHLSASMARAEAGEPNVRAERGGPKDISDMAHAFNSMMLVLELREAELRRFNETLEQRVVEEATKSREKDHMLIQQSRLAAIGEMIGNIAHQWRQPINALTLLLANIKDAFEHNELDKGYLDKSVKDGQKIIQRMSTTIDDFRDFFRPNKEKDLFSVNEAVMDVLRIMEAALKYSNINISVQGGESVMAYGIRNEYAQVLINLLANSKEAIQEHKVADGQIRIGISQYEGMSVVDVEDNAGGIPPGVLPKIFEPYYTTKEKGTGIGLYMSKVIVEDNMGGTIKACNIEGGARLTIATPSSY
ncbi:MAG: ATP-binding protein [Gallionella sp.]|nr:ATP-binding protein [Gallionella sp.]